jgi:hypothetical protein
MPIDRRRFLAVLAACTPVAGVPTLAEAQETLRLPLRVFVLTDIDMAKGGRVLRSWVTAEDIRRTILPEVNRIWSPAGIVFELVAAESRKALAPPGRRAHIEFITGAVRDSEGESDPARIDALYRLIDFEPEADGVITVVLVPYLGEASQGNARRKLRRVVVGQWTDKGKGAAGALRQFPLSEGGVFRQGSISRTVAHELGHILGLDHPDKATQTTFGLLMGGKQPGFDLTGDEVRKARKKAKKLD